LIGQQAAPDDGGLESVWIASILGVSVSYAVNRFVTTDPLENPLYYLENFRQALDWVARRYDDLLDEQERRFIEEFARLPEPSQGLLVRMIMRKGTLFRASKLEYAELGDTLLAVQPLLANGWVDGQAEISLEQLFGLLRKDELSVCFREQGVKASEKKAALLARLQPQYPLTRPWAQWYPECTDPLFSLQVMAISDRLRLLYFGNLYQDWSEFVLADLGVYRYEKVEFSLESRGINERADIDTCMRLHACRQALEEGAELSLLAQHACAIESHNPWLQMRRAKLLFQLGQQAERLKDWPQALELYAACEYPGARSRHIRVLELNGDHAQAMALLEKVRAEPRSDAELQHLVRVLPRLQRALGLPVERRRAAREVSRLDLSVVPQADLSVEQLIQLHLHEGGAQVHYVENALINSLFGLLCWQAVFAPLPGAFFHPFHSGPSDLHSPDFYPRRVELFDACLAQLDSEAYKDTIREHFVSKAGLQSPFVYWGVLSAELLEQALYCLPAEHLRHWFRRLLLDIKANRAGMPDLIQFFPEQRSYRMIEVKGPGDRLQDNQLRWLDFCAEHGMPVVVCYVQWQALES
jgi:hypothetical protein